jgi:hypothetical protein
MWMQNLGEQIWSADDDECKLSQASSLGSWNKILIH